MLECASKMASGQMSSFPKKSELRIGESSAFFTYVKSSNSRSINQASSSVHENTPHHMSFVENTVLSGELACNIRGEKIGETLENHLLADDNPSSNSVPESFSTERSCTPPISLEISQQRNSKEFSQEHMHLGNDSSNDATGSNTHSAYPYPYYMSGIMNQVQISPASMYPKNLPDMHNHANSALMLPYNHIPHCPPHIPGMASYPYYPFGICLQPGQMPSSHPWPSFGNYSSNERKLSKVDRREAALLKFRQKRKERCFDKKIRYVNRKKLAERRPRLRGQFVRKVNGVDVDLNGQPASAEDNEEEYEEEEQTASMDFSPEDDTSLCQQ